MSLAGDLGSDSSEQNNIHEAEKNTARHDSTETFSDHGGHILDANQLGAESQGLQTTHDKKIILIPQPSSDPNDPLNWSSLKKHAILLVITVTAFLPDFGSSIGVVTLLPQAM